MKRPVSELHWERFYTWASASEALVDQIEVDVEKRVYRLILGADERITDGVDTYGEEIAACFVSRPIFDILVAGITATCQRYGEP